MQKLLLIDAYALIYRSYYAFIKNPRINSKGLNTSAVMGFCLTLNEVLSKERPTHVGVAFDPHGPTFRSELYPAYKAQRDATPEDIHASVPIIKDILRAMNIPVMQCDGFEADDIIGTLATKAGAMGTTTYMVTPDKDYGQLVGDNIMMYRPRHGGGYEVLDTEGVKAKYGISSPQQVVDLLALMGDASDNIPGCPGVGEKTAVKLITQFGNVETLLERTEELRGALKKKVEDNAEQIRLSKVLATIRRDVPVDLDMTALALKPFNSAELRNLLHELEFRTIADKLLAAGIDHRPAHEERDLFAEPTVNDGTATDLFSDNDALSSASSVEHEYMLVNTHEEMAALCRKLLACKEVCLDTETTSTNAVDAELVGLSFATEPHKAYYVPVPADSNEARAVVDLFRPLYEDGTITKIGQNIKYDYEVLHRYGVTLGGPMFDTMIAHYLIQPELRHNMDDMAEQYLNYKTIHIDELIGPRGKTQRSMRDVPPERVCEYAAEDADITLQLKNVLMPELKRVGEERLFNEVEMPLVPVLADMELNGVRIDTGSLREISALLTARMLSLEENIYKLAGEHFNIASPKQVGDILFGKLKIVDKPKKTKTGQYVTSEDVLRQLKNKSEIVGDILAHRALKKLLGTYVDSLPKLINPRTGRIHTSFNQAVTATGRLSSSDPNLQNIPVRGDDGKEIRRAFVPEPGCLFFSADYSQVELRILAHLSGDQNMIEAFRQGHDIHLATAAKIYNVSNEDVTRDQRTKAKRANFGIVYGITAFGLAESLDISREEARQLIDDYFAAFPGVKRYMEQAKETARKQGFVETLYGRRRYLPDINSRNTTVRGFAERNAINAPVQGTAADIIKVAMVRIHNRFKQEHLRSTMILQVHDELNFSVVPDEQQRVQQIVTEEMQNACLLSVPLIADSGFGTNWLEAH